MPTDRTNPASPWPDIRKESWLERLRRGVQTARAYPLRERGANQGPLGVAINDLAASVPLPEDFAAMGDMAMRLMDPTGMYGNADVEGLEPIDALARPENLRAMMEYAGEHPVQTAASAFGGPAGIAAYREFAPQAVRNYAHMFYGGGRPMHYIRSGLREAASPQSEDALFAGQPSIYEQDRGLALRLSDNVTTAARVGGYRTPHRSGVEPPPWVGAGTYYDYPGVTAALPVAKESFNAKDWISSFGKSYLLHSLGPNTPSRLWDWYEFFPSSYGFASGKDLLTRQPRQIAKVLFKPVEKDMPIAARLKKVAPAARNYVEAAVPRGLAAQFGTPYAIDASLTSGDALMQGLAPFGAIGGAGEMLPVWARSAAPDSIRQLQR